MTRDYYELLGVDRRATDKDIKAAYRRLARQYHPDVTGEDTRATERFKQISEAYECLSDPTRRRAYDLFGHPDADGGFEGFKESVSELFHDLFNRRAPGAPEPGVDVEVPLSVSFREAFEGAKKPLEVEVVRPCPNCQGQGATAGTPEGECPDCGGEGKARMPGPIPLKRACTTCGGRGKVPERKCRRCGGKGTRRLKETLRVTIPPGVDTGSRLRLKERGCAGRNGGAPGDLYVRLELEPHERFERDGDDLYAQVRVGLKEALIGGSVEVPLPTGSARMTLPPSTQGGQVFRLKGKGFSRLGGRGSGDLFVTVQLRIPKTLDADARRLLAELSERVPDL